MLNFKLLQRCMLSYCRVFVHVGLILESLQKRSIFLLPLLPNARRNDFLSRLLSSVASFAGLIFQHLSLSSGSQSFISLPKNIYFLQLKLIKFDYQVWWVQRRDTFPHRQVFSDQTHGLWAQSHFRYSWASRMVIWRFQFSN